jgi:hypothetical protein
MLFAMDRLQSFIEQNRAQLDVDDPPKGHFDRFNSRLELANRTKRPNLWLVASAAAIAGVILTASLSLLLNAAGVLGPIESGLASVKLSPEMVQIDEYYQSQVNHKQVVIAKMLTGDLKPFEDEIAQAFDDMNASYKYVISDIAQSPHPERAAFVLTRYYQAQLDVLDGIILRMQSVNKFNK